MLQTARKDSRIVLLDSIGSDAPLWAIGQGFSAEKLRQNEVQLKTIEQRVNYVISANEQVDGVNTTLFLTKKNLNQKELDQANLNKVLALFE